MERLRYAHTWRSAIESITKLPFEASLRQMASASDEKCFTHSRVATLKESAKKGVPEDFGLEDIKGAAATVLIAGNDTVCPNHMASGHFAPVSLSA